MVVGKVDLAVQGENVDLGEQMSDRLFRDVRVARTSAAAGRCVEEIHVLAGCIRLVFAELKTLDTCECRGTESKVAIAVCRLHVLCLRKHDVREERSILMRPVWQIKCHISSFIKYKINRSSR